MCNSLKPPKVSSLRKPLAVHAAEFRSQGLYVLACKILLGKVYRSQAYRSHLPLIIQQFFFLHIFGKIKESLWV